MTRKILFYLIMLALPLLLLEGLFRLLPVFTPPSVEPVDAAHPVAHLQPNVDYLFSAGWNFDITAHKHTNNYGYVSSQDFDPAARTPLLALIGDSFVEAQQVDAGLSAAERLQQVTGEKGRVYGIGMSGAPLSQYLKFAEFARDEFHPGAMAVVIISNDYDESLLKYSHERRFHLFREQEGGLQLVRLDYQLGALRELLRHSAFVRYVMLNLDIKQRLQQLRRHRDDSAVFEGNVRRSVSPQRLADSKRAVDEFLRRLPAAAGLAARDIVFVVDGIRPALYTKEGLQHAQGSYVDTMRNYFMTQARQLGYEIIDMQPRFIERHRRDGTRFEFATDNHWNVTGHQLVADALADSSVYRNLFGGGAARDGQ